MLTGKREHERCGNVKITVYQKPTCSTCRMVFSILQESGIAFDSVNYYIEPIPKAKLKELLRKMNMKPRDILRTKEEAYKTLKLAVRDVPDDELLDMMVEHPDLIQRPIVEKGPKAILARPPEKIREIL